MIKIVKGRTSREFQILKKIAAEVPAIIEMVINMLEFIFVSGSKCHAMLLYLLYRTRL